MDYYIMDNNVDFILTRNTTISYQKHIHSSMYVAGIVLSGTVHLWIDSTEKIYGENDYFIISPYTVHAIEIKEPDTCMLTMSIKEEFLKSQKQQGISPVLNKLDTIKEKELLKEKDIRKVRLAYTDLLKQYGRDHISFPEEIEITKNRITACPEEHFDMNFLAGEVHFSKYHFIRRFTKSIGISPHKYQVLNRVRKAQRLLQSGSSVAKAAVETGFYDQSHFIKAFRQIVGITPQEYRRSTHFL